MSDQLASLPEGVGLWANFSYVLTTGEAAAAVQAIERAGVTTIGLQEYGAIDPFVRAAIYLGAMDGKRGRRVLPPHFLGALGPRMIDLAGERTALVDALVVLDRVVDGLPEVAR